MNKEQFLMSKLSNFCDFLETGAKKVPAEQLPTALGFVSGMRSISGSEFVKMIVSMATYKNNLSAAVDRLLMEAQINREVFSPEDLKKAERYLDMFIDIVCK